MKNAYELLQEVRKTYTGARGEFMISRLSLRSRINLESLTMADTDPAKAEKLRQAIKDICPDVSV